MITQEVSKNIYDHVKPLRPPKIKVSEPLDLLAFI